jgi:hypothetical protein
MRVNIYAEEMTDRLEIITKNVEGHDFTALRFYLELPATVDGVQHQAPFIHRPGDDDSSAVTFWGKRDFRLLLRKALSMLDEHYGESKPLIAWDSGGGDIYAGETEDQVRAHIIRETGDPESIKGMYEVSLDSEMTITITYAEEIERLKAKGAQFPICIASDNC